MEGYLFPDTYDLPVGATARQAIVYMIAASNRCGRRSGRRAPPSGR